MTGLVRKATLLSVCGVLIASAAVAGVVSGTNSTVPGALKIGEFGSPSPGERVEGIGPPNVCFAFAITVRDIGNNVVTNSCVKLDFSDCHGLILASVQPFFPATTCTPPVASFDCVGRTVYANSDLAGNATFRIIGTSDGSLPSTAPNIQPHGTRCVKVTAGGVPLANSIAPTYDMNNSQGVNASDQTLVIDDFTYAQTHIVGTQVAYIPRTDFDGSDDTNSADVTVWIDMFVGCLHGVLGGSCSFTGQCCTQIP